jgi:hypothetical protein
VQSPIILGKVFTDLANVYDLISRSPPVREELKRNIPNAAAFSRSPPVREEHMYATALTRNLLKSVSRSRDTMIFSTYFVGNDLISRQLSKQMILSKTR